MDEGEVPYRNVDDTTFEGAVRNRGPNSLFLQNILTKNSSSLTRVFIYNLVPSGNRC